MLSVNRAQVLGNPGFQINSAFGRLTALGIVEKNRKRPRACLPTKRICGLNRAPNCRPESLADNSCTSPRPPAFYSLIAPVGPLFGDRLLLWIRLNPSTADERSSIPLTHRRVFQTGGCRRFLDSQPLRAPRLPEMVRARPSARTATVAARRRDRRERIVAAWGTSGVYQARADAVMRLFASREFWCLGTTQDGHPHPSLYVADAQPLVRWAPRSPRFQFSADAVCGGPALRGHGCERTQKQPCARNARPYGDSL